MAVLLYMDVQVPRAITRGLRARDIDIITAQEDGAARLSDPELLDRATNLQRVLFTFDKDFLVEADLRQQMVYPSVASSLLVHGRFLPELAYMI